MYDITNQKPANDSDLVINNTQKEEPKSMKPFISDKQNSPLTPFSKIKNFQLSQ